MVAIASNAVEHVVGIRFALKAKPRVRHQHHPQQPPAGGPAADPGPGAAQPGRGPDPAQPGLPPLLVAALGVSVVVVAVIIYDGEYTWIEGMALIALYCIIATAFWWG